MTREERCQLAIEKGFTYNPQTGKIYGIKGKEITGKDNKGYIIISIKKNKIQFLLKSHQFAWYCVNKECVNCLDHINRIKDDNRICNLRSVSYKENFLNSDYKNTNIKIGEIKTDKTKIEIINLLNNWDFYYNDKITQVKVSKMLNKSIRNIKNYWGEYKVLVKEKNTIFKLNLKLIANPF